MNGSEEIQLFDYLLVIWRRKGLIFLGALFSAFIAGALVIGAPLSYETIQNLSIGRVWGKSIDDPHQVAARITSRPFLSNIIKMVPWLDKSSITTEDLSDAGMVSASVYGGSNLVSVRICSHDPSHSLELAKAVADVIQSEHKELFEIKLNEQMAYQKQLEERVQNLEIVNAAMVKELVAYRSMPSANPLIILLIQDQIAEKESSLVVFSRELNQAKINNRSKIETDMTRLADPPFFPERKPRGLMKSLLFGGMLGFFVFLFLSFFLEFLTITRSAKRRRKNE